MADLQILIPCFECGRTIFEGAGDWTLACIPDSNGLGAVRYYHDVGECAAKRREALDMEEQNGHQIANDAKEPLA